MNLLEVQRSFRQWLTAESDEAANRLGPGASPGLSVHLNTYRGQLRTCLSETFSSLKAWLGDTAFEAAASIHIDRVPPSSWTLDDYARDFPDTIVDLYPKDPEVFELACLERALAEIFTARDCAQLTPDTIDPAQWARIDWERAVVRFVPTLALLPVTTNAAAIWSAINEGNQPPAVAALCAPTHLVLWRSGYSPRFRSLESNETYALEQMSEGMSFGALCALLVEHSGEAEASALAAGWLGQWLRDGLIAEVV